jgi:type IV pilus assembly protein PilC
MFAAELAMLLEAGLTVNESLLIIKDDKSGKDEQQLLEALLKTLDENATLSESFKATGVFPRYMVHMVEIGEKTGRLVESLNALSEYYNRQERFNASIRSSVLHPSILLIMMIVVVLVLIVQVLPIFNDMFSRLGAQMSALALYLMQFGTWIGGATVVIATVLAVIFSVIFIAWLFPSVQLALKAAFLNRWGGRGVFGQIATSRFVSAMTLALASGLDINDAVDNAAALSGGSKAIDIRHDKCRKLLESGGSLADAMHKSGIINRHDSKMLSIGARSGKTEHAMAEVAKRNEQRLHDRLDSIVGKIEPTLVMISSIIIGVILLSVMLPLMGIMTAIG